MSNSTGLFAQQSAFDAVVALLFGLMSTGDIRVVFTESATAPVTEPDILIYNPNGRYEVADGRVNSPKGDLFDLCRAVSDLRTACYVPGKGTWFGVRITVMSDGHGTAEYNYDSEPEWDVPIDPISYVTDQEKFPRAEDSQPEWLKQKLAEGRARFAERDGRYGSN